MGAGPRPLRRSDRPGAAAQERKILDLVADGLTNRQIAERVFLAENTVKNHVSNVLMKLGLSRRAKAASYMARRRSSDKQSWT